MRRQYASVNGSLTPIDEAIIGIADRGLLYGDGLYETIRVRNGRCIRLEQHLERLRHGLIVLRFGQALADFDFQSTIDDVLEANGLQDARVRLTVTRGESAGAGKLVQECTEPTVVVTAHPLPAASDEPAKVITSSFRRDEASPLCGVKSLNCLTSIMARFEAAEKGADDAIMPNTQGLVAEATTSNLFVVRGNRLLTPSPDQGILPGVTRRAVIEQAGKLGFEVLETRVGMRDILEADEIFLTNAIVLVRPVAQIDDRCIGKSHKAALRLLDELADAGEL